MFAGMTGFVLVSLLILIMTPVPHDPLESRRRWLFIASSNTLGTTHHVPHLFFLLRRRRDEGLRPCGEVYAPSWAM